MHSDALVFRAPLRTALAVVLLAASIGCSALRPAAIDIEAPSGPTASGVPGELMEVDTGGRGLLLVRPDHELGRYDEILIEHVGFQYSPSQRWLSYREEDRISAMLAAAVHGSQDGAIGIAEESGPCVLGVRFYVTDLELHTPEIETGSTVSFIRSFGEATLVLELRDTETDVPVARFMQRRELGGGPGHGLTGTSIRRLGTVVGAAMRDMGRQLERITPPTSSGFDAECKGSMAAVAFGTH